MTMIKPSSLIGATGIAVALLGAAVYAHEPERQAIIAAVQKSGQPHFDETVRLVFERAIPNIPGKSLIALEVTYPPGGKSPPHFHAKSAFIYAHVLSGAIRSQVDGEPDRVYQAGEGFHENPGSHHRVSENASGSEPASLLAVFITEPAATLTIPEKK